MCSKVSSKLWYARITLSLSDIKIKKAMFSYMRVKKQDEDTIRRTLWIGMNGKMYVMMIVVDL
jgi:hypothetical protein